MELLTIKELAEKLKMSSGTIYNLRSEGLPAKIESPLRFIFEDVVEWFINRKNGEEK